MATPVESEGPSVAHKALRKHYRKLVDAVPRGQIAAALFENEVVDEEVVGLSTSTLTSRQIGDKIMKQVLHSIKLNPMLFESFCEALETEPVTKEVLAELKGTHATFLQEQKSEVSLKSSDTEEFQELKERLQTLSSMLQSESSPNVEASTINCIQHLLTEYIEKTLSSGVEAGQVMSDMEKLCRVYLVIPTPLWTWTMQQVGKTNERLTSQLREAVVRKTREANSKPSLFSKDTLYHACICCEAINFSSSANPRSYFESRNPQHNITEFSFSQSKDNITPYLIAKQDDVIYVAFQSIPFLSNWLETVPSFDEGLRQQSSQIPLRFFMEALSQDKKIVLTGFSFGGMLACCIGARLWHFTTADREVLLQRVICITFGQPFLKIKMVEDEIKICPQFEQSIHSVFYKDDVVPLLFGYLHIDESKVPNVSSPSSYSKAKAISGPSNPEVSPERAINLGGFFSIPFVKDFLYKLADLQGYTAQPKIYSEAHSAAINGLRSALQRLEDHNTSIFYGNCYVMSKDKEGIKWQHQVRRLAEIELSQHAKLVANQLDEKLFEEYSMKCYRPLIFRSYLEKQPDKYLVPNPKQAMDMDEVAELKPKVTGLEVYEYPSDQAILLKGENLWFTYKISLDVNGQTSCEVNTHAENTTKYVIEFCITESYGSSSPLNKRKQVKLSLFTHFANPIRDQVLPITKEPHEFSVRQMQLAKHTPTQVIQLAYLCALLEQQGQQTESKRFKALAHFLEEAVKVVPLESVFDAISYQTHEIALECAKALNGRKPQLQPSQLMIAGVYQAAVRARAGYHASVINKTWSIMTIKSLLQVHVNPVLPVHQQSQPQIKQGQVTPAQPQPHAKAKGHPSQKLPSSTKKRGKGESDISYSAVTAGKVSTSGNQLSHQRSFSQQMPQPPQLLPVQFSIPIPVLVGQSQHSPPFPSRITAYLEQCWKDLLQQNSTQEFLTFGSKLCVVSKTNISEVYSMSRRRGAYFKSPLQVLTDAMQKIATYTDSTQMTSGTRLPNEEMLKLIQTIYRYDVAVCAALLGAFMEQQIHIPLLNTPKDTAETLSSQAAPVAVGVWALFSLNLKDLQKTLSSSSHNALIVEIKEYIEGISQQLPENENRMYANDDRMYAGKLQFLLQGIKGTVTASSQYISYSLEHQLCNNLKFERTITLRKLITQWDEIFKDDALYLIAESHRPLVARWLKWTLLVHDLREALAQYTCIGVTGLVNSGKSLLVKKLFGIEKVKVGTRAEKRTTIPLLYNLEGSVDGLDVIDFPGVDDRDHTVPELANLLLSLAQIVVFVVDYRKASSDPVKNWIRALVKSGVPVLICLTYADVLYLECKEDGKEDDVTKQLMFVRKHLKLDAPNSPEVSYFSFKHTSDVNTEDLQKVGIKSPAYVGEWLVKTLKMRFKQDKLADKLREFIERD